MKIDIEVELTRLRDIKQVKDDFGDTDYYKQEEYLFDLLNNGELQKLMERVKDLEYQIDILHNSMSDVSGAAGFMLNKEKQQNTQYRELLDKILDLQLYINYSEAELYEEVLKIMDDYLELEVQHEKR